MDRLRGFWWSPDGTALAVCRVDTAPVQRWHLADPADPAEAPRELPYPAAGTPNADVTLHVIGLDGAIVDVEWDRDAFPYLADVHWTEAGLIASVLSRDQRALDVVRVDPATGATEALFEDRDDVWIELVPGVPRLTRDGLLVTCADRDGARRLLVDGQAVTPPDLQVRAVATVDGPGVVFTANPVDDATSIHVWRYRDGELSALTDEPGVHTVAAGGGTTVVRTATLDEPGATWSTLDGVELATVAATPSIRADVHLSFAGDRRVATAVLLPRDHDGSPLPVLLDPYGGPHAARVVRAHNAHLTSQWFADQGFAVVVADGARHARAAAPSGSVRSITIWRPPSSTTRSPPSTTPPTSTACSTSSVSPSAAGASAATSPRSPCCAGPTSSTPPSPARRSRSGASTTRTTPSATWAIPSNDPTSTTPVRCCRSPMV